MRCRWGMMSRCRARWVLSRNRTSTAGREEDLVWSAAGLKSFRPTRQQQAPSSFLGETEGKSRNNTNISGGELDWLHFPEAQIFAACLEREEKKSSSRACLRIFYTQPISHPEGKDARSMPELAFTYWDMR